MGRSSRRGRETVQPPQRATSPASLSPQRPAAPESVLEADLHGGLDERTEPLTEAECMQDKLYQRSIVKTHNGVPIAGCVGGLEIGVESRERLYFILYADGEAEHMTQEEVRRHLAPQSKSVLGLPLWPSSAPLRQLRRELSEEDELFHKWARGWPLGTSDRKVTHETWPTVAWPLARRV